MKVVPSQNTTPITIETQLLKDNLRLQFDKDHRYLLYELLIQMDASMPFLFKQGYCGIRGNSGTNRANLANLVLITFCSLWPAVGPLETL